MGAKTFLLLHTEKEGVRFGEIATRSYMSVGGVCDDSVRDEYVEWKKSWDQTGQSGNCRRRVKSRGHPHVIEFKAATFAFAVSTGHPSSNLSAVIDDDDDGSKPPGRV